MKIESLIGPGIETAFGQPYEGVMAPVPEGRALRREIMHMTTLVKVPEVTGNGKYIEREIDPDKPWIAFGQVMFIKDHGNGIKKIAAVSMAYPGGVGTRMAREVLSRTAGIDESEFERWEGEKEGAIVAAGKGVPDVTEHLGMMEGFVTNSGSVIARRHAEAEHEVVQHFFSLQETRQDFLDTVRQDALEILNNPDFTGRSAFDPRYKDKGIYLVEGIIKDGVWYGGDPKGEPQRLVNMAADDPHREWLEWAQRIAVNIKGDGIIVDAEDTETVTGCGGNGGCSQFFDEMEGSKPVFAHKADSYREISGISQTIKASQTDDRVNKTGGGGYDKGTCSTCGQYKNENSECNCSKKH